MERYEDNMGSSSQHISPLIPGIPAVNENRLWSVNHFTEIKGILDMRGVTLPNHIIFHHLVNSLHSIETKAI